MSEAGNAFTASLGRPDPPATSGLHFSGGLMRSIWEDLYAEVGAGWYLDRFVYLFGEGLDRLKACLDAWSFLVPPGHPDRVILGRNAYGTILVVEDANTKPGDEHVYVLDPARVRYWTDPALDFIGLFGSWLAEKRIPGFFDMTLYRTFVEGTKAHLEDDEILALKVPLPLGGTMSPENVQVENIVSYYQSTAPIYAKALEKIRKGTAGEAKGTRPGRQAKKR